MTPLGIHHTLLFGDASTEVASDDGGGAQAAEPIEQEGPKEVLDAGAAEKSLQHGRRWAAQFGSRTLEIEEEAGSDGPAAQVRASGLFDGAEPRHADAYLMRQRGEGDRLGSREYWTAAPRWGPSAPTLVGEQPGCRERFPDLFTAHTAAIKLVTSPSAAQSEQAQTDWAKFACLTSDFEVSTVAKASLRSFFKRNADGIERLNERWGAFVPWSDPSRPRLSLAARATEQALAEAGRRPWKLERSETDEDTLADQILAGGLPARIPKSLGVPGPIAQPLVLVTHLSTLWGGKTVKPFADEVIARAKQQGRAVVYLMDDDETNSLVPGNDTRWFTEDRHPSYAVYSHNGEHNLQFDTPDVVLIGGYFEECLRATSTDTITRWFLRHHQALTLNFPLKAVFAHEPSLNFRVLGKDAFLRFVEDHSFLGDYEENDLNASVLGVPNLKNYEVQVFADGELLATYGDGPRRVQMKFWSDASFMK